MNRNSKKGFTIVELIIVIAVIAVLAAVLIPTFSNLIQKANEAKDTALVSNLNKGLKMSSKDYATMHEALQAVEENVGVNVEKISAVATDSEILWGSVNNCFVYLKSGDNKPTYIPDSKKTPIGDNEQYKYWQIVETARNDATYSQYLAGDNHTEAVTVNTGFDAGKNANLQSVTYTNTESQSVVIRTNGGELVVDAGNATVAHYGAANYVNIKNVYKDSYHEYGVISGTVEIASGHLAIEESAKVSAIKVSATTANSVKVTANVTVDSIIVKEGVLSADSTIKKVSQKYEIGASDSTSFDDAVAFVDGKLYSDFDSAFNDAVNGKTLVLLQDVEISENMPITTGDLTIDLAGHNISFTQSKGFQLTGNASFTLTGTGKVYEISPYFGPVVIKNTSMTTGATFTLGKNVTLEGWAALFIDQANELNDKEYNFTANLYGTLNGVKDTSGSVGSGIYINGSNKYTGEKCIKINLYSTAKVYGTGNGIYAAGYSKITVEDGAYIEGELTGIEIRAGQLTVNGGTIVGKGTPTTFTPDGNGATSTGAGIAVAQHTTKLETKVSINGGKVVGFTAIAQENPQGNDAESVAKVEVKISGGTFETYQNGEIIAYFENYEVVTANGSNLVGFGSNYKLQKNVENNAYRYVPVTMQEDTVNSKWRDVK